MFNVITRLCRIMLGLVLVLLALTFVAECLSLCGWNPYRQWLLPPLNVHLYPAGFRYHADTKGLYPGAGRISFRIDDSLALSSGNRSGDAWAMGAASTGCEWLAEDQRWPALLQSPASNYGYLKSNSSDSIEILRYLLRDRERPKRLYWMHALEDLRSYLATGTLEPRPFPDGRPSQFLEGEIAEMLLYKKGINPIFSMLQFWWHDTYGRDFLEFYLPFVARMEKMPELPDSEFPVLRKKAYQELLPRREKILQRILETSQGAGISLVFLTEANAFREDFHASPDLRVRPRWAHRIRLTSRQSAELLQTINQQTLQFAKANRVNFVDVAQCLSSLNARELFWGEVSLTPAGSRAVAHCVQDKILD